MNKVISKKQHNIPNKTILKAMKWLFCSNTCGMAISERPEQQEQSNHNADENVKPRPKFSVLLKGLAGRILSWNFIFLSEYFHPDSANSFLFKKMGCFGRLLKASNNKTRVLA